MDGDEAQLASERSADRATWTKGIAFNLLFGLVNMVWLLPTYESVYFLVRGNLYYDDSDPLILTIFLIPGAVAGVVYWLVNRRWVRRLSSKKTLYWWIASLLFWWISMIWQILRGWIPELLPRVID